jgi:hypothetical protein
MKAVNFAGPLDVVRFTPEIRQIGRIRQDHSFWGALPGELLVDKLRGDIMGLAQEGVASGQSSVRWDEVSWSDSQ